ncbi:MAG: DUF4347 domain-containing protein, partial [Rhizobiaceae bacterium]|nr:DUF4347 domain-containing protein [Rhizobiaceae bacterium]
MAPNRVHKFSDFSDAFQDSGEPSASPLAYRELEPRIAFDAAMAATGAEGIADDGAAAEAAAQTSQSENTPPADTSNALLADALSSYSEPTSTTSEIVFIDTNVDDIDTLIAAIDPNFEIILLDAGRDGVEQIAEILADRSNLDAIHIISHGDQGILNLGTASLTLESMNNEYIDELLVIGKALSENADLLIYGCNFGEGELGALATNLLAQLTGADVAASIDPTGHADLGGDWDLELTQGTIEADVVISDEGQEEWQNLLANTAPTFDVGDGISTTPIGSGNSYARDVVMQSDGKFITVGFSDNKVVVARYNSDGTLDTSFGGGDGITLTNVPGNYDRANSVGLQSDGKIIIAGMVRNGNDDFLIARYNTNGTLDTSFGGGNGYVTTDFSGSTDEGKGLFIQPDNKIIVVGRTFNGAQYDLGIARYNSNGTLDTSFSGDGKLTVNISYGDDARAVTLQSNGKIIVAGSSYDGFTVLRINSNGTLDTSFSGDGIASAAITGTQDYTGGVTVQSNGKIVLSGYASSNFTLVRFNSNGTLDTSFSGDGIVTTVMSSSSIANDVEVLSNGKILIGGYSYNGSNYDFTVARYTSSGVLDTSFGGGSGYVVTDVDGGTDRAYSMFVQPDGKIVLAGNIDVDGTSNFGLVRYKSNGTLDTEFAPETTLGDTVSFTEDSAAIVLDNDVTISDDNLDALNSGNGNYNGASLTLTRNGGASSEDVFSFNDGNGITFSGGNLIKSGQIIASFDTTAVSGQLVITFTSANGQTPTTANVNNIFRQITYSNNSNAPPGSVQVDWTFNDGNSGSQGSGGAKTDTDSTTINITAVNDAPVGLPTISGTTAVSDTLTADTSGISDADGLGAFSFQWLRDGSSISGATALTYTLVGADVSTQISVQVSYTDANGQNEGPLISALTAAITPANVAPVGLPAITGTITEDQTLTADTSGISDGNGLGTFSYQWLRGGSSISGATTSTYTLGDTDVGTLISVQVSFTDGDGTNEGPLTSAQTAAIVNVNDAPVGLPTISGTVTEDQTLTADTSGISDADGLGTFSYQWLRGGSTISGATASTYTLGDTDVGTLISVQVSYTDGEGTSEGPLTSTQTAAIVNVNDTPVGLPTITGTIAEDQTLTADTSGISDADGLGSFSYQWLSDGGAIAGADESTYTLEVSDIGGLISVQVSYTDGNGTSEGPLTSTQTTAVTATNDAPTFSAGTGIVLTSVDGGNSYTQDVIL